MSELELKNDRGRGIINSWLVDNNLFAYPRPTASAEMISHHTDGLVYDFRAYVEQ